MTLNVQFDSMMRRWLLSACRAALRATRSGIVLRPVGVPMRTVVRAYQSPKVDCFTAYRKIVWTIWRLGVKWSSCESASHDRPAAPIRPRIAGSLRPPSADGVGERSAPSGHTHDFPCG